MKKGFSLLTAIVFLVLIATISALSISLSTTSVKMTTDVFLKSQAELLLRSGTEFAMLAMSGHDYNTSCLNQVNITYPDNNSSTYTHEINITIQYLGNNLPSSCLKLDDTVVTPESNRTVIIDTIVQTNPNLISNKTFTEPIRVHRRTIQKP